MLKNEYLLAKIGADTAENEQYVAEMLAKLRDVTYRGPFDGAAGAPRWIFVSQFDGAGRRRLHTRFFQFRRLCVFNPLMYFRSLDCLVAITKLKSQRSSSDHRFLGRFLGRFLDKNSEKMQ